MLVCMMFVIPTGLVAHAQTEPDAEMRPITAERQAQVQEAMEGRTNLLNMLELQLESGGISDRAILSSSVEDGWSGAELLPITPERQEQVQKVLESRINTIRAAFAGEYVTASNQYSLRQIFWADVLESCPCCSEWNESSVWQGFSW